MNLLGYLASLVLLAWTFEHPYRDIAQFSTDAGLTWATLPGPYPLNEDGTEYRVDIAGHSGHHRTT